MATDPLDDPLVVAAGVANRARCAHMTASAGKVVDPALFKIVLKRALDDLDRIIADPATVEPIISREEARRWAAGG